MSSIQLPAGTRVFVDANTLVFHFAQHPKFGAGCTAFMERIGRGELLGFASADVLSDLAHRVMTIEAMQRFGWPFTHAKASFSRRRHALDRSKGHGWGELFHRIWHRTRAGLSNDLLGGEWQRALP